MRIKVGVAALTSLLGAMALAAAGNAEEWDFSAVSKIVVDGVSGNVVVRPAEGSQGLVRLDSDVWPADALEATVKQSGSTLRIDERWHGRNSSGRVEWTILLPAGDDAPRLQVSNASGDLDCQGIAARVDFDTASGDVTLVDVDLARRSDFSTASGDYTIEDMTIRADTDFSTASGDVELNNVSIEDDSKFSTASGDIRCTKSRGFMELSSASGDVIVRDSQIEGVSSFSSASGDVSLRLDRLPGEDLTASSASGDVTLTVNDYGEDFSLVLIKREDKGRITCPFAFTEERTFEDHHVYEEKIVRRGSGSPEIELRTASGRVVVNR
jgi:DUF4097 and DUF4098 domain-containing protein YvlB